MPLSKRSIRRIEKELADGNACVIRTRGRRLVVKGLVRRKYPSELKTRLIRVKKEDWEKIKARANHDGVSFGVVLGNMLFEAYRRILLRQLRTLLFNKAI